MAPKLSPDPRQHRVFARILLAMRILLLAALAWMYFQNPSPLMAGFIGLYSIWAAWRTWVHFRD